MLMMMVTTMMMSMMRLLLLESRDVTFTVDWALTTNYLSTISAGGGGDDDYNNDDSERTEGVGYMNGKTRCESV